MNLPNSKKLEISSLSRIFDNMSESYKMFWFQAIVDCVINGDLEISYAKIIDNMIADAWYMVSEYHLNLGPSDTLESLVKQAYEISKLSSSEKRENIIRKIYSLDNKDLNTKKKTLTLNVPYRLQAPFVKSKKGFFDRRLKDVAKDINDFGNVIYRFKVINGLSSIIEIDENWAEYIIENQEIIKGWIRYKLISYLQRRNPDVPGIPNKLEPPVKRDLARVIKYWKTVASECKVFDIYGHNDMSDNKMSIDHFIPWSYVAHDELWNLSPTTVNINSSKSNKLPDWDIYFNSLVDIEYLAYEKVWVSDAVKHNFDICLKEHVNNIELKGRLYREGLSKVEFANILEEVVSPVYRSAMSIGFDIWSMNE